MRNDFSNRRDYDVLVQSPELFQKSNDQKGALKRQLKERFPTAINSGLSYEDRELNARIQGILSPERIDGVTEEVHHKNALSLIGTALDAADNDGKARIYDLLKQNNIQMGNSILNLINLDIDDHDELHNFARQNGLEMQGAGTKGIALKLMNATTIQDRLAALQEYIDVGIPMLRDKQDDLITAREAHKKAKGYSYQWKRIKR